MRARREEFEEAHINLTPLIDVVFVVLIIFILIAPMLELDRVELASAPSKSDKEMAAPSEDGLTIHVHSDNTIWVKGRRVSLQELSSFLKERHRAQPNKTPQLFQDKRGQFGIYQQVKNAVEEAGYTELDIVLKPG